MDAAYYGHLAGATDIVFHPGSYFERPAAEVLPLAISRLQGCVDELRSAGNPVNLRPETMGKSAMLGSLEDTLEMGVAIPGILPCIDFAHLHARQGDGSMNTYEEWSRALEACGKALGDDALNHMHVHLSGIQYGPKGEKEHLPVQESDLDLQAIFRALAAFGCQGRLLCESPAMENDAVYMREVWNSIREG
jgi:deoxyribonuclease-4